MRINIIFLSFCDWVRPIDNTMLYLIYNNLINLLRFVISPVLSWAFLLVLGPVYEFVNQVKSASLVKFIWIVLYDIYIIGIYKYIIILYNFTANIDYLILNYHDKFKEFISKLYRNKILNDAKAWFNFNR